MSGPTFFEVNGTNMDLTDLEGRYFVIYTVDGLPAACDPQQILITVERQPEVTIPSLVPACNVMSSEGDVCINLIGLVSGAAGDWAADPLFTNSFNNPADVCFEGIDPGNYTFTFTVQNLSLIHI